MPQTPAVRASLPIPRLRDALRSWDLDDADVVEIMPGATSDVFLVMRGSEKWVAKFNYDSREYFEVGLRASKIVEARTAAHDFDVAVPVPTSARALSEMVEWPDGQEHPLALITFVRGDPLTAEAPTAAQVLGDVCGRVHATLIDVPPSDVGVVALPDRPDGDYPDRDAAEYSWLHRLWRDLEQQAWTLRGDVRHAIAVWDGPDIRRRPNGLGVLDFGHCGWHALAHVVANRSLSAALSDETQLAPFLEAVERHLPLTDAEHDQLPLHRLRNAAIYARWVAMEKVARGDPDFNEPWFRRLLALLHRELPRIGMDSPKT